MKTMGACPFCGKDFAIVIKSTRQNAEENGNGEAVFKRDCYFTRYYVSCYYCKGQTGEYKSIDAAIKSWNKIQPTFDATKGK